MTDIKKTVTAILINDEKARESDRYLYVQVCKRYCPEALSMRFEDAFLNANLPNTESVRRARQDAQRRYNWLKPSEAVQKYREDKERQFRMEFSR